MRKTDWKRQLTADDVEQMHESLRRAGEIAAAREKEQQRMKVGTTAAQQRERLRQQRVGHDRKFRFHIPEAKLWMERGLIYFLGERAQWLPCYDEVAAWLEDNQGRGLFCYGEPSLGKTVLTTKVIPMIFRESLGISFPSWPTTTSRSSPRAVSSSTMWGVRTTRTSSVCATTTSRR